MPHLTTVKKNNICAAANSATEMVPIRLRGAFFRHTVDLLLPMQLSFD